MLVSGRLAQLVEHLVYTETVGSSNLSSPTIFTFSDFCTMSSNVKKISFVVFGLIIAAAIFAFTQSNIANAAKKNGKKFGDWSVSCTKADAKTKTPQMCTLTQQINIEKDGKKSPYVIFQIGYLGEKKELKLIQIVPMGISIEAGTSIVSSKKLIAPGRYFTCLSSGCQAVALISDADLKTLFATKENSFVFMGIDGSNQTAPFSVKGLKKGLEYIK